MTVLQPLPLLHFVRFMLGSTRKTSENAGTDRAFRPLIVPAARQLTTADVIRRRSEPLLGAMPGVWQTGALLNVPADKVLETGSRLASAASHKYVSYRITEAPNPGVFTQSNPG